jgi:hypothetical protein
VRRPSGCRSKAKRRRDEPQRRGALWRNRVQKARAARGKGPSRACLLRRPRLRSVARKVPKVTRFGGFWCELKDDVVRATFVLEWPHAAMPPAWPNGHFPRTACARMFTIFAVTRMRLRGCARGAVGCGWRVEESGAPIRQVKAQKGCCRTARNAEREPREETAHAGWPAVRAASTARNRLACSPVWGTGVRAPIPTSRDLLP